MRRLLALRERQKKAAEGELHRTFDRQRREQQLVDAGLVGAGPGGAPQRAGTLADAQAGREAAYARLGRIAGELSEQQLVLSHAKRALKQVEKLVENQANEAQDRQTRQETREQEDWVRARAHGENER